MSVTIKDIARHLGLSISTVSKALNGYRDISAESREKVLQACTELGYHPHAAARNLRRKRTEKLGIAYPVKGFESEIIVGFFRGLTLAAQTHGYNLVLYTTPAADVDALKQICRSREVDGMILMGVSLAGVLEQSITLLKAEQLPFVVLGQRVQEDVCYMTSDNQLGVSNLMTHLLELGHQRIAYIARPDDAENNQERFSAYKQALQRAKVSFNPAYVVQAPYLPYSGSDAMRQLLGLAQPPTAVVAFNDHIAIDACRAAQEEGLSIPQDIAVAGYGNIPSSLITTPAITTVSMPLRDMGEAALVALLQLIETGQASSRVFPTQLMLRASTVV